MAKRKRRGQVQRMTGGVTGDVLGAWIDYTQTPFGPWMATVRFHDFPEDAIPINGPDAHETMHLVLDYIEAYGEEADVDIASVHTLNGDALAWIKYATTHGFIDCAASDNTAVGFIHD